MGSFHPRSFPSGIESATIRLSGQQIVFHKRETWSRRWPEADSVFLTPTPDEEAPIVRLRAPPTLIMGAIMIIEAKKSPAAFPATL